MSTSKSSWRDSGSNLIAVDRKQKQIIEMQTGPYLILSLLNGPKKAWMIETGHLLVLESIVEVIIFPCLQREMLHCNTHLYIHSSYFTGSELSSRRKYQDVNYQSLNIGNGRMKVLQEIMTEIQLISEEKRCSCL